MWITYTVDFIDMMLIEHIDTMNLLYIWDTCDDLATAHK